MTLVAKQYRQDTQQPTGVKMTQMWKEWDAAAEMLLLRVRHTDKSARWTDQYHRIDGKNVYWIIEEAQDG